MGLSVWQLKRQLAWLASRAAWSDSPLGLVYTGGAFVSEDLEANFQIGSSQIDGPLAKTGTNNAIGITPFCRVSNLRTEWDRKSCASRLDRASFRLWCTAGGGAVPGTPSQQAFDTHGINMVTGVNRSSTNFGLGESQGRDIDELISQMVVANGGHFIDSTHAFQGRCSSADGMAPVNGVMVLKRALEVEVVNPLQANYYHPGRNLSNQTSVGTNTLSWTLPPLRFDTLTGIVRRGSTPPLLPTDGVSVPLASALDTSTTDTPGAGVWIYAYFMAYAETAPAMTAQTPNRYSSPIYVNVVN